MSAAIVGSWMIRRPSTTLRRNVTDVTLTMTSIILNLDKLNLVLTSGSGAGFSTLSVDFFSVCIMAVFLATLSTFLKTAWVDMTGSSSIDVGDILSQL